MGRGQEQRCGEWGERGLHGGGAGEREGACVEWESVRRALNKDLKFNSKVILFK